MERLSDASLNGIERIVVRAETERHVGVKLPTFLVRALLDEYRRAPLPTVDASLDELAGLIKEVRAT